MIHIGIVGAGFMGGVHAERYRQMDGVTVSAVVSPNTAPSFVDERDLDAAAFSSLDAAIGECDLDAVDVCSPTPTHRDAVETAASSGLDVFCEKPLAPGLADAKAIADAVETHGVTLMAGHVLRFFPDYRAIRDRVVDGAIGTPGTARARRHSPFPDWGGDWFADDEQSGGVFLDMGIHDFDYLRWLFGDVERVFARRRRWDDRQQGHATLTFESGAVGYVEAGWDRASGTELWSDLELAGDAGTIEYDADEPTPIAVETDADPDVLAPETIARDGYRRELDAFVECVERGTEPPVTVDDAVAAMRVAIAANRSAERGVPVRIAEVEA